MTRKTKSDPRSKVWIRAFSTISIDLAAAWIGVAFVSPGFIGLSGFDLVAYLIKSICFAILFLLVHVLLEGINPI